MRVVVLLFFTIPLVLSAQKEVRKELKILNRTIALGNIKQGKTASARFYFVNTSKEPVHIEYVNPDCSCTDYKLSSKVMFPSDTAYVDFSLNTAKKIGKQYLYSVMKADTRVKMYKFTMIVNVLGN